MDEFDKYFFSFDFTLLSYGETLYNRRFNTAVKHTRTPKKNVKKKSNWPSLSLSLTYVKFVGIIKERKKVFITTQYVMHLVEKLIITEFIH